MTTALTLAETFPKHGTAVAIGPTLDEVRTWPATVDVSQGARALGVSRAWLYQLIAQGDAPCKVLKIGNRARVLTSSLVRLLETGQP